jgi:hypothetical protein
MQGGGERESEKREKGGERQEEREGEREETEQSGF